MPTPLPSPLLEIISIPGLDWTSTHFSQLFISTINSLTASAHKLYSTGIQVFLSFYHSVDHTPILTSELTLLLVVAHLQASLIVNGTYLLENNTHCNNISLLPLGGKTPQIKTRYSMACEFSWLYSLRHTSPQKFRLPQAN